MRVLMSGQSNASGRGNFGPSPATASSKLGVWDNENDSTDLGTSFVSPPPGFNNAPWSLAGVGSQDGDQDQANNAGVWFADRLAKYLDSETEFILVSQGGEPIASWEPTAPAFMYQRILDVLAQTGGGAADVFLWFQGESDASTLTTAEYKSAFETLISNMRSDGILSASAPVIMTELDTAAAASRADINTAFSELADENALFYYARITGLTSHDGTHLEGASLYSLGAGEYWRKYAENEGPKITSGDFAL